MNDNQFSAEFRVLNSDGVKVGPSPLKWQIRLFHQFCANDVPKVCDLPTGMGKTSVIHLWLLALRHQMRENLPRLPTRLVYVVDRRTVVDQATDIAVRIQRNLPELGLPQWLSVSTLRGQFADNRDWAKDPSRPAIVIGTVDMIGSRLLFSGYRSSYKQRPLDAGLLGQDSLLVLDEAHLSRPFEKLVRALEDKGGFQGTRGLPMKVMCMSATIGTDDPAPFTLTANDLDGDANTNPIVRRYEARKRLYLESPLERDKLRGAVVEAARNLAQSDDARVVVFIQNPDDACKIRDALYKHLPKGTVEVLTGTMRGLERDELLDTPVLRRFLDGEEKQEDRAAKGPAVLVSTSAGEVGFDLNADHMVCDSAPLDSMIQRLGRVNRRGYGDAKVRIFTAQPNDKPGNKKAKKSLAGNTWDSAAAAALKCLEQLEKKEDYTLDASPKAIGQLKGRLAADEFQAALSPRPEMVELTDILLDAWSMTTVTERMPGRPPVAPWLRGLSDEEPQTTIAWRAELDVDGFGQLEPSDIEEWFDAHRVLPHETLTAPTSAVSKWLLGRWGQLPEMKLTNAGSRPCIVDRAGLKIFSLKNLVDELGQRTDSIRNSDIILPASFGGIQRKEGLLNERAPAPPEFGEASPNLARTISDVADEHGRHRLVRDDGTGTEEPLIGGSAEEVSDFTRFTMDLPSERDTARQLVSLVPKRQRPEYGANRQTLQRHVCLVEKYAGEIAQRLSLSEGVPSEALRLAAKWHDNGKDREIWQRAVGRRAGEEPWGKSGGSMRRIGGSYRHEFGSLRKFVDAQSGRIPAEVFDLAMHLIAVHHGRGRPHFPKGGFDPEARAQSPIIARDTIRRFARLQRRYGYWHLAWLENLLRCADGLASADKDGQP